MEDLLKKKCVPCEGGVKPFSEDMATDFIKQVNGWNLATADGHMQIVKTFEFKDFLEAMVFVNKVAELAENEGHHPNFTINYNKVNFVIYTHAIGGLSENDFILAAKINELA